MQGRLGFATAKTADLIMTPTVASKVLLNPEGGILMNRIAGLTPKSPSLVSNVRQLIKLMGELNLTAQIKHGGKLYNVGSTEPSQ